MPTLLSFRLSAMNWLARGARGWLLPVLLLATSPAACLGNHFAEHEGNTGELGSTGNGATGGKGVGAGDAAAGAGGAVESTGLRRLTRTEYANTARDLFATNLDVKAQLLADDVLGNFDNNAQALTMGTARLQGYQAAAEALAAELAASPNQRAALAPCAEGRAAADCVAAYVRTMGRRAWRRDLTPGEQNAVVALATAASSDSYAQQVQKATAALLQSPYFLYRVELAGSTTKLSGYELATRLAYFLWRSTPDDALLDAAADGTLLEDDVLTAQAQRMLQDPRAQALAGDFADQWLGVSALATYAPDPNLYPAWDESLRQAAVAQTKATVQDLFAGKLTLAEVLDGNATYINDRLAKFYNMPTPGSQDMVRVAAGARRGLLSQAAVLAVTSSVDSTSIILRGKYVMVRLQCAALGAPPDNAGSLGQPVGQVVTQRQRVEAIEAQAACAPCHKQMDPYGYVLETFDAIGGSRTTDNGQAIVTSTTLPDGTRIADAAAMNAFLAADPRTSACFVRQLLTFALGRTLAASDATQLGALQDKFVASKQRADALIVQLVLSDAFRQRSDGAT